MQILNIPIRHPKVAAVVAALAMAAVFAALTATGSIPGAEAQSGRPAAVTNLAGTPGQNPGEIDVTWDAHPDGPYEYRLKWAKVGENYPKWNEENNAYPTGTSHTATGLEAGVEYKFMVRARFDDSKPSTWSEEIRVTAQSESDQDDSQADAQTGDQDPRSSHFETPQNFRATITSFNTIAVAWDEPTSSDVTYTQLKRTGGGLSDFTQAFGNITEYGDDDLIPDSTYTYTVRFGTGSTDLGPAAQLTVRTLQLPVPLNLEATLVEYDIVALAWENPDPADTGGLFAGLNVEVLRPQVAGDDKNSLTTDLGLANLRTVFEDNSAKTPLTTYGYFVYYTTVDENGNVHKGIDTHIGRATTISVDVPDTLRVSIVDATGTEGGDVVFTEALNRASARDVAYLFETEIRSGDTATTGPGGDFNHVSMGGAINKGQTSTTHAVTTIQNLTYEAREGSRQ